MAHDAEFKKTFPLFKPQTQRSQQTALQVDCV